MRRIVASKPVVMTRGATDRVTCEAADFDALNNTGVLTGNVVMTSAADRRATSDRVDVDQNADTALLTGNVVVMQGRNEMKGRRLFIDRKTGRSQLTSPPAAGSGPGRITAHLFRNDQQAAAKPAKPTKTEPQTDATGLMPGTFKTDPNAPIDIEADQLDVNDTAKVAVFHGDVKAVQGDFVIKSAELNAYYTGDAGLADVTRPTANAGSTSPSAGTQVTRVEARKNVVVTSKDGQTATGDWAVYEAKSNMVTVGGHEVVLTRDQNVVHGTRLIIDMASGESTIDTAPPNTNTVARPGGGGWVTQAPGGVATQVTPGRPSAIFFPRQMKEAQSGKRPAPATSNPSATDGWSSQTSPSSSDGKQN
jgi:lipopolysaccharide transport protein LptA